VVDLCELLARPPEYRGQHVRVSGDLLAGFEALRLHGACGEQLRQEALCLNFPGVSLTTKVSGKSTGSREDIVAVAEVSPEDYLARLVEAQSADAGEDLPWEPVEYVTVSPRRDDLWEELLDIIDEGTRGEHRVTLGGRFEYVNQPSVAKHGDGSITFLRGYGHMNIECRSLLTVSEVLDVRPTHTEGE
jgi:hypothetical protein